MLKARRRIGAVCVAAAWVWQVPVASRAPPGHSAVPDFARLWGAVVVGHASRGPPQHDVPPVRHVCQYGLSNETFEVARFLLGEVEPPVDSLEVHDVELSDGAPRVAAPLFSRLQTEFGSSRARLGVGGGAGEVVAGAWASSPPARAEQPSELQQPACDLVVYSEAAPRFALERVLGRLASHVVVALVSYDCVLDEDEIPQPRCNNVNVMWEKTSLYKSGYCMGPVCMGRVPAETLSDPNTLPLDCQGISSANGSQAAIAEFGQDWFLHWNFLRRGAEPNDPQAPERGGLYVDVGASLPFEYSNTVFFDRCLGWKGICVEPNPHLVSFLQAHRSCSVVPKCVAAERVRGKPFSDREGTLAFHASCAPLGEILSQAGLRGSRIDVLSIDVEHGELNVLRGLPLDEYDIRLIVVEVTQGVRWLEVDTVLLPHGYAKVAVLGRDVVYAKLEELSAGAFADWQFLKERRSSGAAAALPGNWAYFHNRVVEEELEQEARHESALLQEGKRRR